ncbi:MAG: hypothetical protein ACREFP_09100 [Acetobacteraceae bacterium]
MSFSVAARVRAATGSALAAAWLLAAAVAVAHVPPGAAIAAMEIRGHGPAVVFESGQGELQGTWAPVVQGLAPCLTTVTCDRPGIGESPPRRHSGAPVLAAELSPKGKLVVVPSGHFIQTDRPASVVAAILAVATESGEDVRSCQR